MENNKNQEKEKILKEENLNQNNKKEDDKNYNPIRTKRKYIREAKKKIKILQEKIKKWEGDIIYFKKILKGGLRFKQNGKQNNNTKRNKT